MKAIMNGKIYILCILTLYVFVGYTQTPQGLNYQAVVRNSTGIPIADKTVRLRITLQDASQVPYYIENHLITSNSQGVITAIIGEGTQEGINTFISIPWEKGDIHLKAELDIDGGTTYTPLSNATKLQAVPYALFAENTKEVVSQPTALDDDPIFVVKNKAGQIVFAVYQTGVRVYVEDSPVIKGARGGFAVGGLSQTKAGIIPEYFRITPDSARIYTNKTTTKGARGGFAVGGLSQTKAIAEEYLQITQDSARIYVNNSTTVKGARGGFAVGGLSQTKGLNKNYFNIETGDNYIISPSQARILWYPLKNALLTGEVLIEDPNNVGLNSFASGYKSKAKGQYSQALGYQAAALGDYSTAIGKNVVANFNNSFAFGDNSITNSEYSYAFGNTAIANGQNSFAFGESVTAGINSTTSNAYAFGRKSHAKANNSYAMGDSAIAIGPYSFAFGRKAIARGISSYAFGDGANTAVSANNSFAFGQAAQAAGVSSYALGKIAIAQGNSSFAFGDGSNTSATANNSFAFGKSAQANGVSSYALGDGATADGAGSFAFGSFGRDTANFLPTTSPTSATGNYSFAIGLGAKSIGVSSTAIGILSNASGDASTALGVGSNASGSKSLALNSGQAVGISSLAFGFMSKAQGDFSIAIGRGITKFGGVYNLAEGAYSIALGYSRAKGRSSIGIGSATIDAAADNGIGIGNSINIYGKYATGIGSLLTVNSYGAFVVGQNNIDAGSTTAWNGSDPLFIVGNGLSPSSLSNAITILKNGNTGVGTSSPDQKFVVYNGTTTGRYTSTGWTHVSDLRLKENITSTSNTLSNVIKLQAVKFNFINDKDKVQQIGFIAQDFEKVFPEFVVTDNNGFKSIAYGQISAVLVEAIKEQQQQIINLKQENEMLKDKFKEIDALKAELEVIKQMLKK